MVTIKLVDCPAQIVAVPVRMAEVGTGFTVTVVAEPGIPTQLVASVTLVMV